MSRLGAEEDDERRARSLLTAPISSSPRRRLALEEIIFTFTIEVLCADGCSGAESEVLFDEAFNALTEVISDPEECEEIYSELIVESGMDATVFFIVVDQDSADLSEEYSTTTVEAVGVDEEIAAAGTQWWIVGCTIGVMVTMCCMFVFLKLGCHRKEVRTNIL